MRQEKSQTLRHFLFGKFFSVWLYICKVFFGFSLQLETIGSVDKGL
jgi:hypothetical protein